MLAKKKIIIINSRQIKNYNYTFKRIEKSQHISAYPCCELCSVSFFNCLTKRLCGKIYDKFWRYQVYVR